MVSRSDVFLPFCHSKAGLVMAILGLCASGRMWSLLRLAQSRNDPPSMRQMAASMTIKMKWKKPIIYSIFERPSC